MAGGGENTKPKASVSSKMIGSVGYIKVKTFLVPSITYSQVASAFEKTKHAKYMIYDLRNNGGGSGSSVSYLIEGLLGPNRTIKLSRTRSGIRLKNPLIKRGFFLDKDNFGSQLEIDYEKENGFVDWRTRENVNKDERKAIVLINGGCASSCDIFAAAIKEHKAAVLVGLKTAGHVLSGTAYKLLWPGYIAVMPTAQVMSPNGNLYEGIGVKPDIKVPSCSLEGNACLRKAMSILKK